MEDKKIGLVLEGGGLRGAYTAGVLYWLLQEKIYFDYVVGISSGALYASMYVLRKPELLKAAACELAADSRNIGIKPIFREGTFVGYNFLMNSLLNDYDYPLKDMDKADSVLEIGVYDIYDEKTIWVGNAEIARHPELIQAACTLPIAGRAIKIDGKKYMDGGVTTMIPLSRSIEYGCAKHFVVTTKSKEYVRKEQSFLLKASLQLVYGRHPQLIKDFAARKEVYYQERQLIDKLVDQGDAYYVYPSKELGVSRFSGDKEQFDALFQIALDDCEANRDKIKSFYQSVKG